MRYLKYTLLMPILIAVGLTACGGKNFEEIQGGNSSSGTGEQVEGPGSEPTPISGSHLILLEDEALTTHIKNRIRESIENSSNISSGSTSSSGSTTSSSSGISGSSSGSANSSSSGSSSSASSSSASSSSGLSSSNSSSASSSGGSSNSPNSSSFPTSEAFKYSNTNTVQGVDEADQTKYDGNYWYIATLNTDNYYATDRFFDGLQVVATDPSSGAADIVGRYIYEKPSIELQQQYLVQRDNTTTHVLGVRSKPADFRGYSRRPLSGWSSSNSSSGAYKMTEVPPLSTPAGVVRLDFVNVETPYMPYLDDVIELEGVLLDSRRVGSVMYLVTEFVPSVEGFQFGAYAQNEQLLSELTDRDLMPLVTENGESQSLSDGCYVSEQAEHFHGLPLTTHITSIDLEARTILGSRCINSKIEGFNVTKESAYLLSYHSNTDQTDNLFVAGVPYLSGSSSSGEPRTPSWRTSSKKTVIHKFSLTNRVPQYAATGVVPGIIGKTDEYNGDLRIISGDQGDHQLFILEQVGNTLEKVAYIPNEQRVEPLGERGNYFVRFEHDRAHITTRSTSYKTYTVDLSSRDDPKIISTAEIPGVNRYMHPIGDKYLFALGIFDRFVNAELFDTSNGELKLIQTITFGSGYIEGPVIHSSPVGENTIRIAFPLKLDIYQSNQRIRQLGLQLLEVNNISGQAELTNKGMLVVKQNAGCTRCIGFSRGLIDGDAIYFAHERAVWSAFWHSPDRHFGPILEKPESCDLDPLLTVKVTLPDNADVGACEYDIEGVWRDGREALQAQASTDEHICTFTTRVPFGYSVFVEGSLPGYSDVDYWGSYSSREYYCRNGGSAKLNFTHNAVPILE